MSLIDIGRDKSDTSVILNTDTITGFTIVPKDWYGPETTDGRIVFHNTLGEDLSFELKDYDINPAALRKKFAAAGKELVAYPQRFLPGFYTHVPQGGVLRSMIAPETIHFITESDIKLGDGKYIHVGIDRAGSVLSQSAREADINRLIKAVESTGAKLMRLGPDEAESFGSQEKTTLLNTSAISMISQNNYAVNVYFESGLRLDFTRRADRGAIAKEVFVKGRSDDENWDELEKRCDEVTKEMTRELAQKIASEASGLTLIVGGTNDVYVRPENAIIMHKSSDNGFRLSMVFKTNVEKKFIDASAYFATKEALDKAAAALTAPKAG